MPRWHMDYFDLKAIENKQKQEKQGILFFFTKETYINKSIFPL